MLGLALALIYGAGAAGTWLYFMQVYPHIEARGHRRRWLLIVSLGSALWPLGWLGIGALKLWAADADGH